MFTGESGRYNLSIAYFDENDGVAEYKLYVNDELIDLWNADKDLGSASADEKTLTAHTVTLKLEKGDVISIEGKKGTYDPARIDKIAVEKINELAIEKPVITEGKTEITLSNNTGEIRNAVRITASYTDGRLEKVSLSEETSIPGGETVTLSADAPISGEYVIMLWESVNGMRPITEAIN
jgi:hypothetical protein